MPGCTPVIGAWLIDAFSDWDRGARKIHSTHPKLILARKQTGNQLKVVPNLVGGERTGSLIAARNLARQC